MTNLETNFLEVLTGEAARFCSRALRLFPVPLAQMGTALIWDFHRWFCKDALAGPYGSYDKYTLFALIIRADIFNELRSIFSRPARARKKANNE